MRVFYRFSRMNTLIWSTNMKYLYGMVKLHLIFGLEP